MRVNIASNVAHQPDEAILTPGWPWGPMPIHAVLGHGFGGGEAQSYVAQVAAPKLGGDDGCRGGKAGGHTGFGEPVVKIDASYRLRPSG